MKFNSDPGAGSNLIRAYGGGELRVNDQVYRGCVILDASQVVERADLTTVEDLFAIDAAAVLALEPELVLLGTGPTQEFPPAAFGARFLQANIGFEVMSTGAACRTFNVLVAEQRRVVAIVLA